MGRLIARRVVWLIPTFIGVTLVVFLVVRVLPGDPVILMLGDQGAGGNIRQTVEELRQVLGLNDPIPVQYLKFVVGCLHGDLGKSMRTGQPVSRTLADQFPFTVELAFASMAIALLLGVPSGILSALKRNSLADMLITGVAVAGTSMPAYWVGLLLIMLFSYRLNWLPFLGVGSWKHLVMPSLTLGFGVAALIARMLRAAILDIITADHVRTAVAKGLPRSTVLARHVLRNALIPIVTVVGLQLGYLLGGTVVVETVFSRRGLGRVLIAAISNRDYPIVQGAVLLIALCYVVINLTVDVLYGLIDPRIRYE